MRASRKKVILKKRGRPATGNDPVRAMRLSDEFIAKVDAWAAQQPDEPGRSEAIRRLVERGLNAKGK
jgi:cytochrome c553